VNSWVVTGVQRRKGQQVLRPSSTKYQIDRFHLLALRLSASVELLLALLVVRGATLSRHERGGLNDVSACVPVYIAIMCINRRAM